MRIFLLMMLTSSVNGLVRGLTKLGVVNSLSRRVQGMRGRQFVASKSELSSSEIQTTSEAGMSGVFRSIATLDVIGGSSVLLVSPTPEDYSFTPDRTRIDSISQPGSVAIRRSYDVEMDDVCDDEILYGMRKETKNMQGKLNEKRLNRFIGGRMALRRALRSIEQVECALDEDVEDGVMLDKCSLVQEIGPILADAHGAPDLPVHVHGSISHKDNLGVGVAIIDDAGRVGCDIEHCSNAVAPMLANRILTEDERASLGPIQDTNHTGSDLPNNLAYCVNSKEEDVMLRFSFKEAIFKAIHPYLARSVDFTEVEVFPKSNGQAEVTFRLNTNGSSTFKCRAAWFRFRHEDGKEYFITYARSQDTSGISNPNASKL